MRCVTGSGPKDSYLVTAKVKPPKPAKGTLLRTRLVDALQTNVEEQKLQIPLYNSLTAGKPMFCADPAVWKDTAQLLVDSGTIENLPDMTKSFTNEFVSGC